MLAIPVAILLNAARVAATRALVGAAGRAAVGAAARGAAGGAAARALTRGAAARTGPRFYQAGSKTRRGLKYGGMIGTGGALGYSAYNALQGGGVDSYDNPVKVEDYLGQYGPDDLSGLLSSSNSFGGMTPASVGMPNINLPAPPTNQSAALQAAARRAYDPMVQYQQSVIPWLERREDISGEEIKDLRNIAEASWVDTAGRIRTGGQELSQAQLNTAKEMQAAVDTDVAGSTAATSRALSRLGNQSGTETAMGQTKATAELSKQQIGAEGSIFNTQLLEQTAAAADYADTLAGIQDTAAAADIALLAQNMNRLLMEQQGRIAESQQAQAAAILNAGIQGQQMYDAAYQNYANLGLKAAELQQSAALANAGFAQEAAKFNAGLAAEAATAASSSDAEMAAGLAGIPGALNAFLTPRYGEEGSRQYTNRALAFINNMISGSETGFNIPYPEAAKELQKQIAASEQFGPGGQYYIPPDVLNYALDMYYQQGVLGE